MINNLSEKDRKAFSFIRNTIIHQGSSPSLREINEVTGGLSPRSASLVIDRLIKAGLLKKHRGNLILVNEGSDSVQTVNVPLVANVACGSPMLAEENIQAEISVSTAIAKKGHRYI